METGYFHPDRGYWQITGEVPKSVLDGYPDGTVNVPIKPGSGYDWDGSAWVAPVPNPAADLVAWRSEAVASQSQIRLTLLQLGLLATVQAIADADPAAAIVWEFADDIKRSSQFIDALGSESFSPTQIDDIFIYAMALVV
jgi:hypothetical protein